MLIINIKYPETLTSAMITLNLLNYNEFEKNTRKSWSVKSAEEKSTKEDSLVSFIANSPASMKK